MALQSEVSPPLVGDPNKDTQNDGETKSDDNESSSTDEETDLEEGEILDSGEEEEKKDLANSSLKEAINQNCLKSLEQLAKADVTLPPVNNKNTLPHSSPHNSPIKMRKRASKYLDHDRFETNSDQEDGWNFPSRKHKSSKFDAPNDYRKELEAYRGTPPSSPDSKHRDKRKKRSSKKSKKSGKKTIKRKDIRGLRVSKYKKEAMMKKMCKFFKEGKCNKGAECAYSHSLPQSYKKKELCKFYLSGHCNKGKECIYMHGEFPCKFYHTGSECYAKEDCRFSHSPLTDETKRILADYLNIRSGDEDFGTERKRRNSPSPEPQGPPAKRTCLLGSPPRHIREAEETKRWQEEMMIKKHNHPGFEIHLSPSRDSTPPPFTKPNFYQETLLNTPSPQKRCMNSDVPNVPVSSSFSSHPPSSSTGGFPLQEPLSEGSPERYLYEDDFHEMEELPVKQESPDFSWTNIRGMDNNVPPVKNEMEPFADSTQQDLDFTSDVKFDETTQFSEMESSTDCTISSPTNPLSQNVPNKENDESSNQENIKSEEKNTEDASSPQEPIDPIVIPSHLPKRQQELLKRIVQHQKKNPVAAAASDASNSPKSSDNPEPSIKDAADINEKPEPEKTEPSFLYSSDEDDDDESDNPLTNVLKKLQKGPAPVNPPVKVESKPATSLMEMLNKCQQNTSEKKKCVSDKGEFFKNLLSGAMPPLNNANTPILSAPLPDLNQGVQLPITSSASQIAVKKEPLIAPKDPRLKNRDPRTLANSVNSSFNLPKINVIEQNIVSQPSSSLVSQPLKTSVFSNTTTTTVISESAKEDIPYKLRGIYTTPPNYSPYISASQSNPNLLKDPRLRKHMNLNQGNENSIESKKESDIIKNIPKNVPPVPKLLLNYNKDAIDINIFEPSSATKPVTDVAPKDIRPLRPKLTDPRMRRRDSQNSSGSNTPPHLTIVDSAAPSFHKALSAPILENEVKLTEEKKLQPPVSEDNWTPPVLEKSWTPPILEKSWTPPVNQEINQEVDSDEERLEIDEAPQSSSNKVSSDEDSSLANTRKEKPCPASHLPRAIADPRLAKLHSPLDRVRPRFPPSENKSAVELKKVNNPSSENLSDTSKTSDSESVQSANGRIGKNVQKKNSDKNSEKKKTVHRNRRSSMDYASPLNSCDDSNSNKSLNYNSYNQRPTRTATSLTVTDSSISLKTTISDTTPDFLSDNSNIDCDSSDVNLKDMFKTIDPTASPFC